MTDLDQIAAKQTEDLRTRLREDNPLAVDQQTFLDELKTSVDERLKEKFMPQNIKGVAKLLRNAAKEQKYKMLVRSVGTVQHIGNGVATLSGLPTVHLEELVTFPNAVKGMVLNLDRKHVDVILLGSDMGIRGGDLTEATGRRLSIPVGMAFLGRVVDPLGRPQDENRPIVPSEYRFVERIAPGVVERAPVDTPLYTGTKLIDALIPLGRGQRELIIGDRQVGKTTLALDAILSQRGTDVKCIYVAVGQKKTSTLNVVQTLERAGVLNQTIVVASSPDDPPALRYLAPYSGVTMAEFFLDEGMDVLIVYDDLSKHADTYRELSLLLRRPPGREAYPGDIFYLHSRLLERACRLNEENGGGSITALPIVTTQNGNISSYIVTNLISITDGQIILDADMFNKGTKPAIDIGRSVSRVGSSAQEPAMKEMVKALKLELSQFEEVSRFARFGAEVNEATRRQIERGERLMALLRQGPNQPVSYHDQVIMFYAMNKGYLEDVRPNEVLTYARDMVEYVHTHAPKVVDHIRYQRTLMAEEAEDLDGVLEHFTPLWLKKRRHTS